MKDVLLIDTAYCAATFRTGRRLFVDGQFDVYVATSSRQAVEMLRALYMDVVIIRTNGPEEIAMDILERVKLAAPLAEVLFLPAAGEQTDRQEPLGRLLVQLTSYLRYREPWLVARAGRRLSELS